MDIFEHDDVHWPTRVLQQEEEEQAVSTAAAALQTPQIRWHDGTQPVTQPQLLVIALSPASSTLLEAALTQTQAVATIQPAPSPTTSQQLNEDSDKTNQLNKPRSPPTAQLYAVDSSPSSSSGVLVCCCRGTVGAESAPAWARGVLQQLQSQKLLLIGTMQAEQYRGDADPSQDFTAYLLQTSAAAAAASLKDPRSKNPIPFLPSGSLVAGLPAALITQAELRGILAQLVVVVDTVPALVPETLHELSKVMCHMLGASKSDGDKDTSALTSGLIQRLQQESVVDQSRTKLYQTTCQPTSVYS